MTKPDLSPDDYPLPSMQRMVELIMDAARSGRDDVIPALLQAGVDVDARDAKGYTPLILASYNGRIETTELLLARGASIDLADDVRGNTALMGVAFKGFDAIAALLLCQGADANRRNASGQTALMLAALFGHTPLVDMLLDAGADPDATDAAGNSPASVALTQGNRAVAERIRAGGNG